MKYFKGLTLILVVIAIGFTSNKVILEQPTVHNISIIGDVDWMMNARVRKELESVYSGDIVIYHIKSPGGLVDAGNAIKAQMIAKRGVITQIAYLEGDASSMGWDILITADFVKLVSPSRLVVHASYIANEDYSVIIHDGAGLARDHDRQRKEYINWLLPSEESAIFNLSNNGIWLDYYMNNQVFLTRVKDPRTRIDIYDKSIQIASQHLSIVTKCDRLIEKHRLTTKLMNFFKGALFI